MVSPWFRFGFSTWRRIKDFRLLLDEKASPSFTVVEEILKFGFSKWPVIKDFRLLFDKNF